MPYFRTKEENILFIHIPKTGGSSIEKYFSEKYNIPLQPQNLYDFWDKDTIEKYQLDFSYSLQHLTYQTIKKYQDFFQLDFNNLKIITIVRNPYFRIISDLFYFKKINLSTHRKHIFRIMRQHILFNEDNHALPQYLFLVNEDGQLLHNLQILHTENLTQDMYDAGYVDFNCHENCNQRKINYLHFLTKESIQFINSYYHQDFELFQYQKIKV